MARRTKEQKERIRKSILKISEELFSANGYNETSTKKIAENVGIAEGTIFNYFESKSEIFFEIFTEEDHISLASDHQFKVGDFPSEIIAEYLCKIYDKFLIIPKKILKELILSSAKMANKRPKLFNKLASLDYKYIKEVEYLLDQFVEKGLITKKDTKLFSEIIYSVFAFELLVFLYETDMKKEEMLKSTKSKLKFLFNESEEL